MPNLLEEELRAIQNTITETRKECRQRKHTDNICVKKIALLRAREHEILQQLGAQ